MVNTLVAPGLASALEHPALRREDLVAVLRDLIPAYRIRLPSAKELTMPVSADVERTCDQTKEMELDEPLVAKHAADIAAKRARPVASGLL